MTYFDPCLVDNYFTQWPTFYLMTYAWLIDLIWFFGILNNSLRVSVAYFQCDDLIVTRWHKFD